MAALRSLRAESRRAGQRASPRGQSGRLSTGAGRMALPWIVPLGLLGFWWLAIERQWVLPHQLPPPQQVLDTFAELLVRGELIQHVTATVGRLLTGYGLGAAPGILLGIMAGMSPPFRRLVDPTVQGVRAVPSLAWVPLFLLWFGIGEQARVLLIALGAFLPVYFNTVAGVGGVDRRLVEVGQAYGFGGGAILWRIVLPAALPGIFTGLRAGLSLGWMFVVAAELIAANNGLGFLLVEGQATMRPDRVLASLIAFAALGRLSDALLEEIERRVLHWRDTVATAEEEV
ncbi:Putative aliphatic sulfonates transport permease protein SsuC [bacterium HR26]|nr:Putative aliphatic sulfonates transport permease protein SsuC [bacterium HR26]